jgi:hypothetical protein
MPTQIELAVNHAANSLRQGMGFYNAVRIASETYDVSYNEIQLELSKRGADIRQRKANQRRQNEKNLFVS